MSKAGVDQQLQVLILLLILGIFKSDATMSQRASGEDIEVGVYCSVCKSLDFLPFHCQQCQRSFCKAHASKAWPEEHNCPINSTQITCIDGSAVKSDSKGLFKDLLPDTSQSSRADSTQRELDVKKRKEAALALLHKNFPQTAAVSSRACNPSSSKPVKPPNRTIILMKLKQKAIAGDARRTEKQVLPKDRRYFIADVEPSRGKSMEVWLPSVSMMSRSFPSNHKLLMSPEERILWQST